MKNEKKRQIGLVFHHVISNIGMDKPSNFDEIVDFIFHDVCETADEENWNSDDVVIGFRRWIESRSIENTNNH